MYKHNIFLIWMLLTVTNVNAQVQTKNQIKVSINKVIDNFQKSIIEKDSILLKSLFFDKTTPIITAKPAKIINIFFTQIL